MNEQIREARYWNWKDALIQALKKHRLWQACSAPGPADEAVADAMTHPAIEKLMNKAPMNWIVRELREYGAWDDDELKNREDNLQRLLWTTACDIREGTR
jgi:hypothetical protein